MSIESQIQSATSQHAQLLSTLSSTDHAKPDLTQHQAYLSDLNAQLSTIDKRLKELDSRREKDLKDHVKYRDSVFRRFAYKASGQRTKFEEKADKEEKEYFEGLQESQVKRDTKGQLEQWIAEADKHRVELERLAGVHDTAQRELDNLYSSIFAGPSPNFPIEDQLEQASDDALQEYELVRQAVEGEGQAYNRLQQADQALRLALKNMSSALGYSTWDMWGGGSMSDMMERNELSKADRQWNATQMSMLEARHASPHVGALPSVTVAAGSLMSDVFFDNIFTDMAFHDKIKETDRQMGNAYSALLRELENCKARLDTARGDLQDKEKRLEESRVALQNRRTEIFREVAQRNGQW